jgi:hypothetical protein
MITNNDIPNKEELPDIETVVALSIDRLQKFNATFLEYNPTQRDWLLGYTRKYLEDILTKWFPDIKDDELKTHVEKYNHLTI